MQPKTYSSPWLREAKKGHKKGWDMEERGKRLRRRYERKEAEIFWRLKMHCQNIVDFFKTLS